MPYPHEYPELDTFGDVADLMTVALTALRMSANAAGNDPIGRLICPQLDDAIADLELASRRMQAYDEGTEIPEA